MLKDVWMEGLEKFAFFILFVSDFITCYMTLPSDKRTQELSRKLQEALSTDTSGTQVFSSDISTISNFSTFSKPAFPPRVSLSWLWNLYFISPLLPQILPFVLDFYVSHLGVVIWSWLSSCFLWWVFYALTLWVWPLTVAKIQNNPPVQLIRKTQTLPLFLTVGTSVPLLMAPSWEFETKQMILEICMR